MAFKWRSPFLWEKGKVRTVIPSREDPVRRGPLDRWLGALLKKVSGKVMRRKP